MFGRKSTDGIPDEALDDRLGFTGTAGSGKTYTSMGAVERLLKADARVIIIDPLDVYWGLRSLPDGKTPSQFDIVIFGGAHADLPINEHAGAIIGETIATMAESCIVSLGEFETAASQRRFMLAMLTALYKCANREPVHLIFDEADMWAPQRILDREGDATKLLGKMEAFVRRGRIRGFIPWLITQRPAVLSKNVLSQVDGLVAMKLTSSQDRKAIGAWVEGQADEGQWKKIYNDMASLQRGQGIMWLPSHDVLDTIQFPKKLTFDSSATPKRGELKRTAELQPVDISALKNRLSTVEEEIKSNDPKALKTEIARLNAEIRQKSSKSDEPRRDQAEIDALVKAAEKKAFDEGRAQGIYAGFEDARKQLTAAIEGIKIDDVPVIDQHPPKPSQPRTTPDIPTTVKQAPAPRVNSQGTVGKAAMQMLELACQRWPVKFTWTQLASLSGRKARGGSFNTAKREMVDGGLVEEEGNLVVPTDAAFIHLNITPAVEPVHPTELLMIWTSALPSPADDLLRGINEWAPITKEMLAERLGRQPRGGSWNTAMRTLRDNKLISENSGYLEIGEAING